MVEGPSDREADLERHRENLERLHEATNRLYEADSKQACYDVTIEAAVNILGFDWCTVAGPTPAGDEFELMAVSSEAPLDVGHRPFGIDEGLSGQVYRTKESSIVEDVHVEAAAKPTIEAIRSALTVPVGNRGIFQAVSTDAGAFDEQDRKHAELLVAAMNTALERTEQEAELRERQRELERQNERLEEFTSVVSHDLRNPLNVADARLELAREDCESDHLDDIGRAHERMNTLINDLLTLAREGEGVGETLTVSLTELVQNCWNTVDTGHATLVTDVNGAVMADPSRLQQLLENLVRNAIEHGGDDVTVTVGSLDDGFYVADDGPGIDEGEIDSVFDVGYSTSTEGNGFGLSIVQRVVESHDWEIAVTESSDGGARFEITGVEFAR